MPDAPLYWSPNAGYFIPGHGYVLDPKQVTAYGYDPNAPTTSDLSLADRTVRQAPLPDVGLRTGAPPPLTEIQAAINQYHPGDTSLSGMTPEELAWLWRIQGMHPTEWAPTDYSDARLTALGVPQDQWDYYRQNGVLTSAQDRWMMDQARTAAALDAATRGIGNPNAQTELNNYLTSLNDRWNSQFTTNPVQGYSSANPAGITGVSGQPMTTRSLTAGEMWPNAYDASGRYIQPPGTGGGGVTPPGGGGVTPPGGGGGGGGTTPPGGGGGSLPDLGASTAPMNPFPLPPPAANMGPWPGDYPGAGPWDNPISWPAPNLGQLPAQNFINNGITSASGWGRTPNPQPTTSPLQAMQQAYPQFWGTPRG